MRTLLIVLAVAVIVSAFIALEAIGVDSPPAQRAVLLGVTIAVAGAVIGVLSFRR